MLFSSSYLHHILLHPSAFIMDNIYAFWLHSFVISLLTLRTAFLSYVTQILHLKSLVFRRMNPNLIVTRIFLSSYVLFQDFFVRDLICIRTVVTLVVSV